MTALRLARRAAAFALAAGVAIAAAMPAWAQRVPIVRDAEIEALVRDYASPILKAAGLSRSGVEIVLVNDPAFNAFVSGRRIFINTGALMQAETPNEIIGVIAHETGHLAGGHQERLRQQLERAQTMAVVSSLLGIGAVVAGATGKSSELAQAGAGIAAGGTELARRGLLSYQRTEETTADRSAITYLDATGQSAKGMLKTFQRFQNALSLSGSRVDPYQVSHPMPRERIANLETLARSSPYYDKPDADSLQLRHDMARVKIAVYTDRQGAAARMLKKLGGGLAGRYGDAIQTMLYGNPKSAIAKASELADSQPGVPYFQELLGEAYMKANRPREAAAAFAKADKAAQSKSGLIQIGLGQALVAAGDPESLERATKVLRAGLDREPEYGVGYRSLAQAYGQLGRVAEAELATADGHFYSGNYKDAKLFAARAQQKFKRGAPGWLRAQDIINYKAPSRK